MSRASSCLDGYAPYDNVCHRSMLKEFQNWHLFSFPYLGFNVEALAYSRRKKKEIKRTTTSRAGAWFRGISLINYPDFDEALLSRCR